MWYLVQLKDNKLIIQQRKERLKEVGHVIFEHCDSLINGAQTFNSSVERTDPMTAGVDKKLHGLEHDSIKTRDPFAEKNRQEDEILKMNDLNEDGFMNTTNIRQSNSKDIIDQHKQSCDSFIKETQTLSTSVEHTDQSTNVVNMRIQSLEHKTNRSSNTIAENDQYVTEDQLNCDSLIDGAQTFNSSVERSDPITAGVIKKLDGLEHDYNKTSDLIAEKNQLANEELTKIGTNHHGFVTDGNLNHPQKQFDILDQHNQSCDLFIKETQTLSTAVEYTDKPKGVVNMHIQSLNDNTNSLCYDTVNWEQDDGMCFTLSPSGELKLLENEEYLIEKTNHHESILDDILNGNIYNTSDHENDLTPQEIISHDHGDNLNLKPKILKVEKVQFDVSQMKKVNKTHSMTDIPVEQIQSLTNMDKLDEEFSDTDSNLDSETEKDAEWSCEESVNEDSDYDSEDDIPNMQEMSELQNEAEELRQYTEENTFNLSSFNSSQNIISSTMNNSGNNTDPEYALSVSEQLALGKSDLLKDTVNNSRKTNLNVVKKPLLNNNDLNYCGIDAPNFDTLKVSCANEENIAKDTFCKICNKNFKQLKDHLIRSHSSHPDKDEFCQEIDEAYSRLKNLQVPVAEEKKKKRVLKKHMCPFCDPPKDYVHLKKHLKSAHKDTAEVQEMMRLDKATTSFSREPMKKLLYRGDAIHNSSAELNKGDLRVARKTMYVKTADEFTMCSNCNTYVVDTDYRKHRSRCTGENVKSTRNIAQEGRALIPRCSKVANDNLRRRILSRMSNDAISKAIRYDDLIMEYGNELTSKLRGVQHRNNIVTQLRRLGRLKLILNVKKLEEMFFGNSELVVRAIEKMAEPFSDTDENEYLKYPTVARNLNTIIKSVCGMYEAKCIKKLVAIDPQLIANWNTTYQRDFTVILSRMASESKSHNTRHKDYGLPNEGDPQLLYDYLSNNLKSCYQSLKTEYSESTHIKMLKFVLTYLQIYNRRRPGDVERILLEDYVNLKTVTEVEQTSLSSLNENLIDLAKEYSILKTRGKLNRDIKLLVTCDLKIYLDLMVELRPRLNISPKNLYLFALPQTPVTKVRYPSAYVLLYRYARACGAVDPSKLRATTLRKDLATKCIQLNLNDNDLKDLAGFMGHHVNVHVSHYRKQLIGRDIPMFVKFLEAATGNFDKNSESIANEENISQADNFNECTHSNTFEQNNVQSMNETSIPRQRIETPAIIDKTKKPRWTDNSKKIIMQTFPGYMRKKTAMAPSAKEIQNMVNSHPNEFQGRTVPGIKTYMFQNRGKLE
ncbi:hypothetical protein TKK_0014632 [Trichogramma kaykai]